MSVYLPAIRGLHEDVVNLFHYLTGHAEKPDCNSLLVAPVTMRPRMLDLIIERSKSSAPDNRRASSPR